MVRMAVRIDESLNIQEQLRIVFLGLFSPSTRNVVHTIKPALELMDAKLHGRALPTEGRLGESRAAVEHRHGHLTHRFSPTRPRYIVDEPGNESDHFLRNSITLQNTLRHRNLPEIDLRDYATIDITVQ